MRLFAATLSLASTFAIALAQPATPMSAPAAGQVVKVRSGFTFLEGPACDAEGNLFFVDLSASKLYRLDSHFNLDLVMENTGNGAGLMFDKDGRLFMTQFGAGKLVEVDLASKTLKPVAETFEGKNFANCNDLTIDSQGGIYFTDPLYGANNGVHPQGKQSVYYAAPESGGARTILRAMDDDKRPNGVILSPDEKTLYVLPAGRPALVAYPITSPGHLGEKKEVAIPGSGDGVSVDAAGNVYVAMPGKKAIQEVKPDLTLGKSWDIPGNPANCEFGGEKLDTLFITAGANLYSLKIPGVKGYRLTTKPVAAKFPETPAKFYSDIPDTKLIEALQAGTAVVVFRHGATDPTQKDTGPDCDQQKNLTPEGRSQLSAIAENLKSLKITFAKSVSSPMCRAKDTAKILAGSDSSIDPALASEPGKGLDALLAEPSSGNTLLVTHSNILGPLAPAKVRMVDPACCLIYAKDSKGTFRCVAYVTPADWDRLAHAK